MISLTLLFLFDSKFHDCIKLIRYRFIDTNKAHGLCLEIQQYYRKNNQKTKVLPASLTNIDEIMILAGVNHITIAPALLRELAATPVEGYAVQSIFDKSSEEEKVPSLINFASESDWRIAFTRSGKGEGERKLSQVSLHLQQCV